MINRKNSEPIWGARLRAEPSMINVYYCAGRDPFPKPPADELLIPYDIWLNKVHSLMLHKQKIIDRKTAVALLKGLDDIATLYRNGVFKINQEKEDVEAVHKPLVK